MTLSPDIIYTIPWRPPRDSRAFDLLLAVYERPGWWSARRYAADVDITARQARRWVMRLRVHGLIREARRSGEPLRLTPAGREHVRRTLGLP